MNYINIPLLFLFALMLGGCGGSTPIKELALPPVSIIEGSIVDIDKNGFILKDESGSIYVKAKLSDNKNINIHVGEEIIVYGNLQGAKKIFDGYVIEKSSGEQIIITNPKPHFGFILQTSFK